MTESRRLVDKFGSFHNLFRADCIGQSESLVAFAKATQLRSFMSLPAQVVLPPSPVATS